MLAGLVLLHLLGRLALGLWLALAAAALQNKDEQERSNVAGILEVGPELQG